LEVFTLIIAILFFLIPFIVLYYVARDRGRSPWWALLGFLGLLGLIIGLVVLLSTPRGGPSVFRP
jgi:uncharacterized membrane protein HdeD (DUF308 family)